MKKKKERVGIVAGTGEEEKSGAGHVVRRDNLFLVAPRTPPDLHRENLLLLIFVLEMSLVLMY
jgi:hypothetical protein